MPAKKSPESDIESRLFGINYSFLIVMAVISPIIFTLIVYPDSFSLSWNEGRGGFLFAAAFIAAELIGIRITPDKSKFYIVIALAIACMTYFILLPYGIRDSFLIPAASTYEVQLVDSWIWMWDFIVMSVFVSASMFVVFRGKWLKIAPAAAIYLAGSAAILSLDAFFPYDALGPLQIIVPFYLEIDESVIRFIDTFIIDIGPGSAASARGNMLVLNGLHGPFALQVFWPSAGVHSMIIYTLVMAAFLLKMNIPAKRKLVYFIIGTFGTASINIIRIISLSLYALVVTTNVNEWEAFHSIAGEIMFLPWLGIYLLSVMFIEKKGMRSTNNGKILSRTGIY